VVDLDAARGRLMFLKECEEPAPTMGAATGQSASAA